MPELKELLVDRTREQRQSWREQWAVMAEWSMAIQKRKALLKELEQHGG